MINKFVNNINLYENDYTFYGDDNGDFEESSDDATEEVLIRYIEGCKRQIKLSKNVLLDKLKGHLDAEFYTNKNLQEIIKKVYGYEELDIYE